MKIAILSDFHLGYERFAEDAFMQAQSAMAQAVEQADAILLAGDLFDTKLPRPETISQAFSIFRLPLAKKWETRVESFSARDGRANLCPAPVVAIHGTHEMRVRSMVNPIQLLESGGFLVNAHSATAVLAKGAERVAITGMGGVPERQAKGALEALDSKPVPGACNIFVFHQTLSELIPAADGAMSAEDLPAGFDIYVSGHLHAHSDTNIDGRRILIPGSTVITQLRKEEAKEKGFYIFDTESKSAEFMEIASREFIFRELELSNAKPDEALGIIKREIERAVSSAKREKPVIRFRVSGTLSGAGELDTSLLEKAFSGRAFLVIDQSVSSGSLKQKVEQLRGARQGAASLRDMEDEIFFAQLRKKGIEPTPELQELMALLSSGRRVPPEEAIKKLLPKQDSQQSSTTGA